MLLLWIVSHQSEEAGNWKYLAGFCDRFLVGNLERIFLFFFSFSNSIYLRYLSFVVIIIIFIIISHKHCIIHI